LILFNNIKTINMDLPKAYQHKEVEDKIYQKWEKSGYFNPDNLPKTHKKPFCIIMPPTNANGNLHLGHALVMSIEDAIVRYQRMQGKKVLWLPGADHAGFETQIVYEKKLEKENRSRFNMTREEFYQEVWNFTQNNKQHMINQVKRLGGSCDWSREKFTLDSNIIDIVYDTFEQMYKDGLIYRGNRIVNYCPKHKTAFSDLETQYIEEDSYLYYIKYWNADLSSQDIDSLNNKQTQSNTDNNKYIVVASTRPETIPGDLAVAVNPLDKRYKNWVGKKVIEPITKRAIPIIVSKDVDIEFGTGALKVTPNHDATDFEIGKENNLGFRSILNLDGKLNENAGPLQGLKPREARIKAIQILKENNTFIKQEPYKHNISVCYKCGTPIEPIVMPQWFVAMTKPIKNNKQSLRDIAIAAVRKGDIQFIPKKFEKIFFHWMKEIKDWNISRQIWWGIPIPAWYNKKSNNKKQQTEIKEEQKIYIGKNPPKGDGWVQDTDVFDTWFSSSQWPFATLMSSKDTDFDTFYPTDIMETGYDILFFWVSRMIMMGLYKTGKVPFKKVLLHGIIRDKSHQKMSKSKGNIINPMDLCDQYGADALRWSLLYGTKIGDDTAYSEDKIIGARNFINKVWNASKFVIMNLDGFNGEQPTKLNLKYSKLIKENEEIIKKYQKYFDKLELTKTTTLIYKYFWFNFCDKTIENLKQDLNNQKTKPQAQWTLYTILKHNLKMLHPFIPFITEYIWGLLPIPQDSDLIINRF